MLRWHWTDVGVVYYFDSILEKNPVAHDAKPHGVRE